MDASKIDWESIINEAGIEDLFFSDKDLCYMCIASNVDLPDCFYDVEDMTEGRFSPELVCLHCRDTLDVRLGKEELLEAFKIQESFNKFRNNYLSRQFSQA